MRARAKTASNKVLTLLVGAALLASGVYAAVAVAGNHGPAQSGHVTICHRTGSHHNPYVVISPSAAGVFNGHYSEHNEHAVFPNTASDGKWGDIIPPFQYKGVTYSLNWNAAGQAIWSNGCATATSGGTTTAPGGTTTGTTPGGTTTVTTPGGTTTVTTPGGTTTVTTPGGTTTVTTPGGTTTVTTPSRPHRKKHHRQVFTPPKVKLPHTS